MPEQPNYCTGCGKLMPDTNAAYYCSKFCMDKVRGAERVVRNQEESMNTKTEKVAHTPGPWRVKPVFISQTTCSALHFGEYRLELPQPVVNENATLPREIANANARLIAAAPEMLEALELAEMRIS